MAKIFSHDGLDWFYEDGVYSSSRNGQFNCQLSENDLPDPDKMFTTRLNANSVNRESPEAELLRPNPVTYKLWEHKNANINA